MSRKHWTEIDGLYAIGAILVVLGHSHSSDWSTFAGTILDPLLTLIYAFHMPLFFFVAGFLFLNSRAQERDGYGSWIGKKAARLLTPYAVLSIAAMIPKYLFEHHSVQGLTPLYILQLLLIPRAGVWGHFWFLPTLFGLYAIFGFWRKMLGKVPNRKTLLIITGIFFVLYVLPVHTQWLAFDDIKSGALLFCLGMLWEDCLDKGAVQIPAVIKVAWIPIGLLMAAVMVRMGRTANLQALMIALIMISVCWCLAAFIGENVICRWISHNNFTIYIYSWPFQAATMVAAGRMHLPWYGTTAIMLMVGFAAPACMVLVYRKLRFLHNRFFDLLLGVK